jgi:phage shock protein A
MEARIARLEESVVDIRERLTAIETRLDQTATKTDLADLKVAMRKGFADMIKWVVGTAIVLGATGITVITFVLDHA